MAMALRLSDQDQDLIKRYAKMKGTSVSDVIRRATI